MRFSSEFRRSAILGGILIFLCLSMLISSWVPRIFYVRQLHDWEDGVWHSLGVDPELGRLATALVFVGLVGIRVVLGWKRRSKWYGS